jgi:hypothetical protein
LINIVGLSLDEAQELTNTFGSLRNIFSTLPILIQQNSNLLPITIQKFYEFFDDDAYEE